MINSQCGQCKFFKKAPLEQIGECLRFPPQLVPMPGKQLAGQVTVNLHTMYPKVSLNMQACYEFAEKEQEAEGETDGSH